MKMEPPAELKALLDAYIEITGLPVTLSYQRSQALTELHARGVTADDVRAVLQKLKRLVASGTKGYSDASLDFRNTLGNVDTFEERVLKCRQEAARRRRPPTPIVAHTTTLPDGQSVTRLAPAAKKTEVPKIDVKKAFLDMAEEIGKAGQQ